jgi:hypothetical protein
MTQNIGSDSPQAAAFRAGDKPSAKDAYFRAIVEIRNNQPTTICAECGREIDIKTGYTCCETGLYYCSEECLLLDLSERKAAGEEF